jgi:hypothetical protein
VLRAAFGTSSEEAAENFLKLLDDESVMSMTYGLTRQGGGSRTARALTQQGRNVGVDAGEAYAMSSGEPIAMAAAVFRRFMSNFGTRIEPEDAEEIARIIVGRGDDEVVRRIFAERIRTAIDRSQLGPVGNFVIDTLPYGASQATVGTYVE